MAVTGTVTGKVLDRLAGAVRRRDFRAFVRAVERLPAADRDILAVVGASALLRLHDGGRLPLDDQMNLSVFDYRFRLAHSEASP